MKPFYLFVLCFGFIAFGRAQSEECNCKSDLEFLNEKIQKLPSYKRNKKAYQLAYQKEKNELIENHTYFECFEVMHKMLLPLKDWHMTVIQNQEKTDSLIKITYPKFTKNLNELRNYLKTKEENEIEGIYYAYEGFSLGIIYVEQEELYQAVVLENEKSDWKIGEIAFKLLPLPNQYFKFIGALLPSKQLVGYYERINQGIFLRSGIRKNLEQTYFYKNPYPNEKLVLKSISPEIDYLRVGSFDSHYPYLAEAEKFYKTLVGKLNKPNLILDLRDNGGGGERNSDILLKILKKYMKNNTIHVLTNASTGSNAERFTLSLKRNKNVKTYGDQTRAALAYEIKPNDYYTLPSTGFMAILPSKLAKKYLEYETQGVEPDLLIDYKQDWIKFVQLQIEKNQL